MSLSQQVISQINSGKYDSTFSRLYGSQSEIIASARSRYINAILKFEELYGKERHIKLFSAPGRTEIGGNHTDHNHGRVLAAAINLDVIAVVSPCEKPAVTIKSEGYNADVIDLSIMSPIEDEVGHSGSLIRGICSKFSQLGYKMGGFDAYTTSDVLKGSGLSSSAAFEVLVATILNDLFNDGVVSAADKAKISQYAENVYFGKPSGLMDQMASSSGGFVTIDFKDTENPIVKRVDFDFSAYNHALCIVDTKGNHADLTEDYAACRFEMNDVAKALGKEVLREVDPQEFYANIQKIREQCSDRAALRAIHFFGDNDRVSEQVKALENKDFEEFKKLVVESGQSSFMYLQNIYSCKQPTEQGVALALALSDKILKSKGAWRVHGGGFAGTIQAFVPFELLELYRSTMRAVFGEDCCYVLSVRPYGGIEVVENL